MVLRFLAICLPAATAVHIHNLSLSARDVDEDLDGLCGCKTWQETYKMHEAKCGEANEYYTQIHHSCPDPGTLSQLEASLGEKYCKMSLMRIHSSHCINMNVGDATTGQWCYVSNKCPVGTAAIPGGKLPGKKVSWKMCGARDVSWKNLGPKTVFQDAYKDGIDPAHLMELTYTTVKDYTWAGEVDKYFCGTADEKKAQDPAMVTALKAIEDAGETVLFYKEPSGAGKPAIPFIILEAPTKAAKARGQGPNVYELSNVEPTAWMMQQSCPHGADTEYGWPYPYVPKGFKDGPTMSPPPPTPTLPPLTPP